MPSMWRFVVSSAINSHGANEAQCTLSRPLTKLCVDSVRGLGSNGRKIADAIKAVTARRPTRAFNLRCEGLQE